MKVMKTPSVRIKRKSSMKRIALFSAIFVSLAATGCQKTVESLHWKSFDQAKKDGVTDIKLTGRKVDSFLCGNTPAREFIATGSAHSAVMSAGALLHGWACPDRLHFSTPQQAGPPSDVALPDWEEFDILKNQQHWKEIKLTGRTAADLNCTGHVPARELLAISADANYLHGWVCPDTVILDGPTY
jgi:hypothetical protein